MLGREVFARMRVEEIEARKKQKVFKVKKSKNGMLKQVWEGRKCVRVSYEAMN